MFTKKVSELKTNRTRKYKWFKFPNLYYCGGLTWLLFYNDYGYSDIPLPCAMIVKLNVPYAHYLIISDVRYDKVDNVSETKDIITLVGFTEYINSLNLLFSLFIVLGIFYCTAIGLEYIYEFTSSHLYMFGGILGEAIDYVTNQ